MKNNHSYKYINYIQEFSENKKRKWEANNNKNIEKHKNYKIFHDILEKKFFGTKDWTHNVNVYQAGVCASELYPQPYTGKIKSIFWWKLLITRIKTGIWNQRNTFAFKEKISKYQTF